MSDLRTVRLRSGTETVNGITGETGPVFSEYVLLSDYQALQRELAKLRHAVDLAARAMHGEGVDDQAQAWDVCLRILDAARADFPEETK